MTAAFDDGRLTSNGGVVLLAQAECAIGIAGRLAGCISDPRDQSRVVHDLADNLRARLTPGAVWHPCVRQTQVTVRLTVPPTKGATNPTSESIIPDSRGQRGFLPISDPCYPGYGAC